MSIKTLKDAGSYVTKYTTRAGAAVQDYANGVAGASGQAAAAAAAADKWQQSVSAPSAKSAFVANVNAAGDAAWKNGVQLKGQQRYAPGVTAGGPKWAAKVQKFFAALKGLSLPARGLRGSAANAQISAVVQAALHAAKTGGTGA